MIKKALFNAIVVLTFSGLAQATTYYVSPIGSDSYNGTSLSTPFKTIQKAANSARAGDTVFVKAGNYPEFSLGYMYEKMPTEQFNGLKIGFTIPLWENRNKVTILDGRTWQNLTGREIEMIWRNRA